MKAKEMRRHSLLARTSMLAIGGLLFSSAAYGKDAQTAKQPGNANNAAQTSSGAEPGAPGPAVPSAANTKNSAAGEIVITGSALRTSPDQVAVPVSVISNQAILKGGVANNALELVRKQVPSFAGRSNTGNSNATNTNQNTGGGSQAQLRNLDTLVLINGRRAAVNPIAGLGGKVF